jgi:hypothetical protein
MKQRRTGSVVKTSKNAHRHAQAASMGVTVSSGHQAPEPQAGRRAPNVREEGIDAVEVGTA